MTQNFCAASNISFKIYCSSKPCQEMIYGKMGCVERDTQRLFGKKSKINDSVYMQIITPYFIFKVCIFTYITFKCEKYLSSEVPLEVNQENFQFLNDSLILNHCIYQAICIQIKSAK